MVTTSATGSPNAGVNVEGIGFVSTGPVFTDVTRTFSGWGRANSPWSPDPTIPVDAYGYPLVDAGAGNPMRGYPTGVYTLRYQGTGEVSIFGLGHLITPITTVNGVKTAQVLVDNTYEATGGQLYVGLRNVNPNDPIRNLHIIMPGYDPANPPTFSNEFLDRLRPFSTVRFMAWMNANGTSLARWADRTRPDAFSMTGDSGVAYEYMIEVANVLHKDIWVNVPLRADDNFVRQFAAMLRNQLDPSLNVYVEYSNELWNGGFPQYHDLVSAALVNPALTATDPWERAAQQVGYKIRQIGQIFKSEFGAQASRIRPVLDAQAVWDGTQRITLSYMAATGSVGQDLYGLAIAPYLDYYSSDPNLTVDQLFAGLYGGMEDVRKGIALNRTLASQYGLSLLAYEGGQGLTAYDNATFAVKQAAQHDPRMGRLLRSYYDAWAQGGGSLFMQFTISSLEQPWGYWGLLTSNSQVGSVKYDAMMASYLPGGDATLDNSVGFDDFNVLSANYGLSGTKWWAQGDFNADNVVNDLDLAILKRNIRGLTAAQGLAVSLFGLPTAGRVGTSLQFLGAADPNLRVGWQLALGGQPVAQGTGPGLSYAPMSAGAYTLDVTVSDAAGSTVVAGRKTVVIS
ncbi:MAG: PKD domain-containing protein [Isosphaeraceae bacterium]